PGEVPGASVPPLFTKSPLNVVAWSVPPVKLKALLLSVTVLAFITPPERLKVALLVMPNSPAVVLSVPAEMFIVAPSSAMGAVGTIAVLPVTWPAVKLNSPPVMLNEPAAPGAPAGKKRPLSPPAPPARRIFPPDTLRTPPDSSVVPPAPPFWHSLLLLEPP